MTLVNNNLYFNTLERKVILDKAIDILFDDATSTEQCLLYHILHHTLCISKKHLMIVFKKDRTTITHALIKYKPTKELTDKLLQGFNKYRENISE